MIKLLLCLLLLVTPAYAQSISWDSTKQGKIRNAIGTVSMYADTARVFMLPLVLLPPNNQYPLDTINIYRTAGGQLRPTIISVDSTDPFRRAIDRTDSAYGRTPFRIWVHKEYMYAYTASAYVMGATVGSPMDCPLKTPWQAPIWNLRWSPPDTAKDPNIIAPLKVAEAAAAQLPISAIRNMARLGMEIYIKKIPRWPMGELVYTECYGPIPP